MIAFTIFQHNKQIVGFSSMGHAGYAERGSDIICAAVSILVFNTVDCIESFTEDEYDFKADEEAAQCSFRLCTDTPCAETQVLLRALKKGILSLVQEEGADYIDLFFKEV